MVGPDAVSAVWSTGHKELLTPWELERRRAQTGTTRCACGWFFEGLMSEGVLAARQHRRDAHPELPVETPPPRRPKAKARTPGPKKSEESVRREREERERKEQVLAYVRANGPARARDVAAALGLSVFFVSATLGWAVRDGTATRDGKLWRVPPREAGATPRGRTTN